MISFKDLLTILPGKPLKSIDTVIYGVNIYANLAKTNTAYFCLNSLKYNTTDGGLGFTNNEDSVYGFGGIQNGHTDIPAAIENGASVIIIDELKYYNSRLNVGWILVDDSLQALIQLTRYCIQKNKTKVIAITGSTGKTTTCQALVDSLSVFTNVQKIHRIRNSILAICIEVLQDITISHNCLVIEMQLDGYGQIDRFCDVVKPDISILTNINLSHLSRFNSVEEVLFEKLAVYRKLKPDGFLLINDDNDTLHNWSKTQNNAHIKKISALKKTDYALINKSFYGSYNFLSLDVSINNTVFSSINLCTTGTGVVYATLFALATADLLGLSLETFVQQGTGMIRSPIGRFNCFVGINNSQIIIDSYNASFISMVQGIEYISTSPKKKKILILGSMLELAEQTESQHRNLGKFINCINANFYIITLGEAAMYITTEIHNVSSEKIHCTYTYEDIIDVLNKISIDDDTIIFIKGSGAMRMELIVPYLLANRIF